MFFLKEQKSFAIAYRDRFYHHFRDISSLCTKSTILYR